MFVIYSGNQLGSGFAIGKNCIISNAHVIGSESDIIIKNYSGDTYPASIIAIDYSIDIVVLTASGVDFQSLPLGDDSAVAVGDDVYTIGAPGDLEYTLTKGIISAKDRAIGDYTYLQIDAAINSGNSGGPLLNSSGEVIGVNSMKVEDKEGIGFSIPITTVISYLEEEGIDPENITQNSSQSESLQGEDEEVVEEEAGDKESEDKEAKAGNSGIKTEYLFYGLSAVLFLAVVLIVIVYNRNKTKRKKVASSERTDFDIDIYE